MAPLVSNNVKTTNQSMDHYAFWWPLALLQFKASQIKIQINNLSEIYSLFIKYLNVKLMINKLLIYSCELIRYLPER